MRRVWGVLGAMAVMSVAAVLASAQPKTLTIERTAKRLGRGRYLANGPMHCFNCHVDQRQGDGGNGSAPVPDRIGAGQNGPPRFPNITPDPETGIGKWTDEQVLKALREGIRPDGRAMSSQMPWNVYSALTEE